MKEINGNDVERANAKGFMIWQVQGGSHVVVCDDNLSLDYVEDAVNSYLGSGFMPVTPASPVEIDNAIHGQACAYYLNTKP